VLFRRPLKRPQQPWHAPEDAYETHIHLIT
jgi:hypothetical protein